MVLVSSSGRDCQRRQNRRRGQEGYFGTGSFQVLLNHEEIIKWNVAELTKETDIDNLLNLTDNDACSKENIVIKSSINDKSKSMGVVDDDYDFDL